MLSNGLQGTYLHARGIAQKPGGWKNARYNMEMGAAAAGAAAGHYGGRHGAACRGPAAGEVSALAGLRTRHIVGVQT